MFDFAVNLKKARLDNNLTQAQMAEKLKMPIRSYQNYESRGKNHCEPDQQMLLTIAKILDSSVSELLGEKWKL